MITTSFLIIVISFLASLVRSTLGFGESLVAVPLFLLFLPSTVAVPVSVMLSIIIALIIVIQDYSKIHFGSAKWLILFSIFGVPLGILLLIHGNETWIKRILGIVIIGYSLYSLGRKSVLVLKKDSRLWLFVCGFLSGILGGAYGLNGPPLVVYGNLRKWTKKHFRATLQAYFLPVSLIGFLGYYAKGLITSQVHSYFLLALISCIPAVFLGRYLNHRLKDDSFFKYAYIGLIAVGMVLIIHTF